MSLSHSSIPFDTHPVHEVVFTVGKKLRSPESYVEYARSIMHSPCRCGCRAATSRAPKKQRERKQAKPRALPATNDGLLDPRALRRTGEVCIRELKIENVCILCICRGMVACFCCKQLRHQRNMTRCRSVRRPTFRMFLPRSYKRTS